MGEIIEHVYVKCREHIIEVALRRYRSEELPGVLVYLYNTVLLRTRELSFSACQSISFGTKLNDG